MTDQSIATSNLAQILVDLEEKHAQKQLELAQEREALRSRLLTSVLLNQMTEKMVVLTYSGYGNSGDIQECNVDDVEVQEFLWNLMYSHHSGFENNDGGNGEITWDLLEDKIHITHNVVIEAYETTEHDL